MTFELEVKGLEEASRKLRDLRRRLEALEGQHSVALTELLSLDFLRKYTEFETLEDMFKASGFVVESQEDFEKIPDDEWDSFIKGHTQFSNWKEMLDAAGNEWVERRLGF